MTREQQRAKAAHEYIQSDSVAAGNEILAFGDFINGAEWADSHPQWIPVEEELPEKEKDNPSLSVNVIVTDGSSTFESYYSFNTHMWAGADIYGTITHWMPLPAPPKKGGNHDK